MIVYALMSGHILTNICFQYLGDRVSDKVKMKVIEMLYSWTISLPDEAKICEAYQMLKSQGKISVPGNLKMGQVCCGSSKQIQQQFEFNEKSFLYAFSHMTVFIYFVGIVVVDPEVSLNATLIPSPSPRPKNPVFDDEKKSKVSGTFLFYVNARDFLPHMQLLFLILHSNLSELVNKLNLRLIDVQRSCAAMIRNFVHFSLGPEMFGYHFFFCPVPISILWLLVSADTKY